MTKRRAFGHLRKLPSGRWQASYIGPDGKRHNAPLTFSAKTDATQWLVREEASIIEGRWLERNDATAANRGTNFREFASRHIEVQTNSKGNLLRVSTIELYRRLLSLHLREFFELDLHEISSSKVSNWWAKSSFYGKHTTISKSYKLLSAIMNRAVREGLIDSNPCNVRGAHSASTGIEIVVPTAEEVRQIALQINPRFKDLVMLLAVAGLRFGEATELRVGDITRDGDELGQYWINISRAVIYVNKSHIVGRPKSPASVRRIPISQVLDSELDALLDLRRREGKDALLFPSASGGHLRHDVFTKEWKRALGKAGIPRRITPHSLRHFAGSSLARAGANLAELKVWLGDSSTSAVMRYIHDTGRTNALVQSMEL